MDPSPLVTCVIPTCNRPSLLCRALDSVFEQTYEEVEVIVVISPPHEPVRSRLQKFATEKPNLKTFYIQDDSGANVARNRGINEARGKYIAFLDDDDIWKPKKLEMQVEYLDTHSIVSCLPTVLTEGDALNYDMPDQTINEVDVNTLFHDYDILLPSSLVFRTRELQAVGGFDEDLRWGEVWDVSVKILERYDPCYILDEYLLIFDRKHDQERLSESDGTENLEQALEVYHRHRGKVDPEIARKTGIRLMGACFQETRGFRRYKHLISKLRKKYQLKVLRLKRKGNIPSIWTHLKKD